MNRKQMLRAELFIFLLAILSSLAAASTTFEKVNFTSPLGIGALQNVYAEISSNDTISSVNIEVEGQNYSMSLLNNLYSYSWQPQGTGSKSFKIYASDAGGYTGTYSASFEVRDLTPPQVTSKLPSGIVTTENAVLGVTTNENSDCKYGTENKAYPSLPSFFSITGQLVHQATLMHLSGGQKTYFTACKDPSGNIAYDNITFFVNLPPSAQITLSQKPPLRAGTYKITLATSKPLSSVPKLQYKYDDEQKYYDISLLGADSDWAGYLVVVQDSKDRIGSFQFQGTDYDGLIGTKITSGGMFVIDTTKPAAPSSIDAVLKDDAIELSWFYDGEEADHYNIYRSTLPGVEYVDYYEREDATPFTDSDLDFGETYYYRVAAVDKAGNIGEISSEAHILFRSENSSKEQASSQTRLSEELEERLNISYSKARTLTFDTEYASSQLDKETDRFKSLVIKEMHLSETANSQKSDIQGIISELDNMRGQDLKESEFEEKIGKINEKISRIEEETVSEITIIDSLEFTASPVQSDVASAVNEVILRKDIESDIKANYTKEANFLQDSANIFETIIVAKLKSLNGEEKYITLVKKEVSASSEAFNVIIYEEIPKTFSQSAKDITFSQNPKILKDDPVVYWDFPKLESFKYSYYTFEKRQISDVKDSKTIVLPDPLKFIPKKGVYSAQDAGQDSSDNSVTGNFVLDSSKIKNLKDYIFIGIGVMIIAALVVYYFFFTGSPPDFKQSLKTYNDFKIIEEQSAFESTRKSLTEEEKEKMHILSLLEHAEFHANSLNFEKAAKEYAIIYSIFKSSAYLTSGFKFSVSERIRTLHKRIATKSRIAMAESFTAKGDFRSLRDVLLELYKVQNSFSETEKVPLREYVSEYLDYYSKILGEAKKKN